MLGMLLLRRHAKKSKEKLKDYLSLDDFAILLSEYDGYSKKFAKMGMVVLSNERLVSRMNNILYAMIESFKNMQEEIHRVLNLSSFTEEENNKLFLSVGTCLHSILDYADRVKIEKKDEKLVSAFRYANNSLKHCIEVKDITKQNGGFTFPIEFPLVIAKKEVVWSIIDNGGEDKKNQRNNYKKLLEEKEIIETCKNVIEILEKYEL